MKKNILSLYNQNRPSVQNQLIGLQHSSVLKFSEENPISFWIDWFQEKEGSLRPFFLEVRSPLPSLLNSLAKELKVESLSAEKALELLKESTTSYFFILQNENELDLWISNFFFELLAQENQSLHYIWISGKATSLQNLAGRLWHEVKVAPEDRKEDVSLVAALLKEIKWPQKYKKQISVEELMPVLLLACLIPSPPALKLSAKEPLLSLYWSQLKQHLKFTELEEKILGFASLEGKSFSADLLYRLLQEHNVILEDQDVLEDLLDERLSGLIEHLGFYQKKFSCYQFLNPWLQNFLRKECLKTYPEVFRVYKGLLELLIPVSYWSEGVKGSSHFSSFFEEARYQRYSRFGTQIHQKKFTADLLTEEWIGPYYNALGHSFREIRKYTKSAKYFQKALESQDSFENFILSKATREQKSAEYFQLKKDHTSFEKMPVSAKILWGLECVRVLKKERNIPLLIEIAQETISSLSNTSELSEQGGLLHELGSGYLAVKEDEVALKYFYQAKEFFQKGKNFLELVHVLQRIFDIEFKKEEFDKAISALNCAKRYLVAETPEWFLIYHRLGYFYQMFGDLDLALGYFEKAEKDAEQFGPIGEVLELYTRIAHIYGTLLRFDDSEFYYKKALRLARERKFIEREALILVSLADIYVRLSEIKEAYNYYLQGNTLWKTFSPEQQQEYRDSISIPLEDLKQSLQFQLPELF